MACGRQCRHKDYANIPAHCGSFIEQIQNDTRPAGSFQVCRAQVRSVGSPWFRVFVTKRTPKSESCRRQGVSVFKGTALMRKLRFSLLLMAVLCGAGSSAASQDIASAVCPPSMDRRMAPAL